MIQDQTLDPTEQVLSACEEKHAAHRKAARDFNEAYADAMVQVRHEIALAMRAYEAAASTYFYGAFDAIVEMRGDHCQVIIFFSKPVRKTTGKEVGFGTFSSPEASYLMEEVGVFLARRLRWAKPDRLEARLDNAYVK